MKLYRVWSVAQQTNNAMRDARTHLTSSPMRVTLCGRVVTERWESMSDVLGEDFEADDIGCKRCRKIATTPAAAPERDGGR